MALQVEQQVEVKQHPFTLAAYERICEADVFEPGTRVELIQAADRSLGKQPQVRPGREAGTLCGSGDRRILGGQSSGRRHRGVYES